MICPKCLDLALSTDWKPPEGYDPYLLQFKCIKCGFIFYVAQGKLVTKYGKKKKIYNR